MYYSNERTHSCHKSQGFLHDFCLNRFHLDFILSVNCWNISELFSRSLRVEIQNKKQTNKQTKNSGSFIHSSTYHFVDEFLFVYFYLSIYPLSIHLSFIHPSFIHSSIHLLICPSVTHSYIYYLFSHPSSFIHPFIYSFLSAFSYFADFFLVDITRTTIPAMTANDTTTMTAMIPAVRPCMENSGAFSST